MLNRIMSEKNLYDNEDPSWQTHMQTLTKRKRSMEIAQIIDDALEEYYSEQGLPVPNWKQKKDPQWWTDYLNELGIDKDNP
jgi:type II secretory pathway pseudopilin PulG